MSAATTLQMREAYRCVMDRVGAAAERSGRRREDVAVVAVTKYASPDQVRALVDLGHADLGESRVQQIVQRVPLLAEYLERRRAMPDVSDDGAPAPTPPDRVRWHMIGHLQRNKVKQVAPLVDLLHSVDSLRLAEECHQYTSRSEKTLDVLLQLNVANEKSKHGIAPPAAIHLAEQIDNMIGLNLRGVMTMAPYAENPETVRDVFARTRELFEDIRTSGLDLPEFNVLSMGMSGDFEVAIEEGANVVRIGRAIFGEGEGESA